jgi:acyl-CoA dehydrogenase
MVSTLQEPDMDFGHSEKVEALRTRVSAFMNEHVIPLHRQFLAEAAKHQYPLSFMENLKTRARSEGLWNLFLPGLKEDEPGTRLANHEYAPLAEIMGQLPWASEVFNCSAPDTGNMELLHMFGTPEQRERWLKPLMNGEIRSCFGMTEPDVASSDATNIATAIRRVGDNYVIDGRKWFTTGALHPSCKLIIVMGKTDTTADTHRQQSMCLVPLGTSGLKVVRNISVMNHHSYETHCEVVFDKVTVPAASLLGQEGEGFAMAQARLGPGRIHHCMRLIGQAELALALMIDRSLERVTFGKHLHEQGVIQEMIANSRCDIDQARLLVLRAAWLIDKHGVKAARNDIAMIKVVVPSMQLRVIDRAMQCLGAMGLSPDTPLPDLWTMGRATRIADGPDEVHLRSIARNEIRIGKQNIGATQKFLTRPDRSTEVNLWTGRPTHGEEV